MNEEKMDDRYSSCNGNDIYDMCVWKTAGADNNIYRKRNGKARIPGES